MAYPLPSKETKAKLRQLAADITADPAHFDMHHWMIEGEGCGSVGCLAGTVCLQAGYKLSQPHTQPLSAYGMGPTSLPARRHGSHARVGSLCTNGTETLETGMKAAEILGLTGQQAGQLFLPSHWPPAFRNSYKRACEAEDHAEAACVTAQRLRHFCETGE